MKFDVRICSNRCLLEVLRCTTLLGAIAILTPNVQAQSAVVTGGSIICDPGNGKEVTWSGGSFSGVDGYTVVGCYAPVYYTSPTTYYSPGSGVGEGYPTSNPGSTSGSEVVNVPLKGPGLYPLQGVYVWFEYGEWNYSGGYYHWNSYGALCSWYWIPNPGGECFSAETQLLTPEGFKPIEHLSVGDLIYSSPRDKIATTPSVQEIKKVEVSRARLFNVVAGGHVIQTTQQHPFYEKDKGWIPAIELVAGDSLRSHTDKWVTVDSLRIGDEADVYSVSVDGKSSIFVGESNWDFSILVADSCSMNPSEPGFLKKSPSQRYVKVVPTK
ncbi:polymorphic toxin-type HINT domain-containing protein [Aureliella helgolandensis]|uniref:Hint domain-containing protein n=1 Tax=Aureliella helgolandensis TaxID=2527968 RepID=A0A518G4D6_9BACT|nr:polymorphic toxin-type HINT domain-containing protein [Aureliella helgolandensis]QDV23452.1 hypothetical protein Q31a_17500 [Aureliella helgolandensis]